MLKPSPPTRRFLKIVGNGFVFLAVAFTLCLALADAHLGITVIGNFACVPQQVTMNAYVLISIQMLSI